MIHVPTNGNIKFLPSRDDVTIADATITKATRDITEHTNGIVT